MGFGMGLIGLGQSYPQFQQNEQNANMNDMRIKQMQQQSQNEIASRAAQAQALRQLAASKGMGPGGAFTPQQIAGFSDNPDAFNMIRMATNPYNTGAFNVEGRNVSGQYGLDRAEMNANARRDVASTNAEAANNRAQMQIDARKDIVGTQQAGANERNKYSVDNRKGSATNPTNIVNTPEYRTAKSKFEEAKKDERNIIARYPMVAMAYDDPQWMDARRRALAAQKDMEAIQSKAPKETTPAEGTASTAPAGAPPIPPEAIQQLKEGQVTQFGNGQKWTLENGQPKQVQ